MPRKPRLSALLAYLFLITLGLLLYVSARGPQQEGEVAESESWGPEALKDGRMKEDLSGSVKKRGRNKELPPNPHDYHMMINKANLCSGDQKVRVCVCV